MHFIIIAIVVLCMWGVWRLIRAQIEKGGEAAQDESAPLPVTDADARKSDQS
jgi:flagellar biogenesis protein FliO